MNSIHPVLKAIHRQKILKWSLRLLFAGCLAVVIWNFNAISDKPLCEKCNVILVSLDTLSALHLPCYGYERNTAPNLCAFADKNLLFLNSYSHSPTTLDSHFSIFTSLYPHTHGMKSLSTGSLNEKNYTLAQIYRNNGYQTIYHGALDDLHLPLDRGIERGFNTIEGSSVIDSWESAYKLLDKNIENKKNFFMFLHTYAVHDPYLTGHSSKHLYTDQKEYENIPLTMEEYTQITPEFAKFAAYYIKDWNFFKSSNDKNFSRILEELKNTENLSEAGRLFDKLSVQQGLLLNLWSHYNIDEKDSEQVRYLRALYDEQIHNLDQKLGKLLKMVESPKYSENTILVITADHGEEFMEHGNLFHGLNLYRTSTQVPLIIHIPGVKPKKIKEMVQGIDIYPTLLSITGFKPQSRIEGIDLTGMISASKNALKNEYLLSEVSYEAAGVQMENWRFYYRIKDGMPLELYNLETDPLEQKNVLSQHPEKREALLELIDKLNIPYRE